MNHNNHHRPTRLARLAANLPRLSALATFAATFFIIHSTFFISGAAAQNLPQRWPTVQRGLILVPDEAHAMTTDLAVKRLRSKSPIRLDLVDGPRDNRTDFKNYDLVIILGVTPAAPGAAAPTVNRKLETVNSSPSLAQAWTDPNNRPKNEDAWALKTISQNPLVIVATGNRPRAVLYAVWKLADKLAAGDDISSLALQEEPRVGKRYAVICGTAYGGSTPSVNRHTLYMSTVDEMPRYGINGIFLCPGQWRVGVGPGSVMPPLVIDKTGKISVDESKLAGWRAMIGELKAYDMDIITTIEPLVPPAFNARAVEKDYIMGGKPPAGYLAALDSFFRDYLEKMIVMFPDIDGYVLHAGVEGAQYSGSNAKSIRTFLTKQNINACVENMQAYLKVADDVAARHNKTLAYWTHQWGANSDDIKAMRQMLFKYPRFTLLEEDYWPNGIWIRGSELPIMAFLDEKTRNDIDKHGNQLGLLALSDCEYYGGGSLPNAIAEPYIYSMNEAVKRNVGMVIFRLNLHDRTPYGSLWSTAGIQLEQSTNILWQNPAPPQQVYDTWVRRAYGPAAAPLISQALANCYKIIYDGLTLEGSNMLVKRSRVYADAWLPSKGVIRKFANPGKTAKHPYKKSAVIESSDQEETQAGGRGNPTFAEYKEKSKGAAGEVARSLALIEQARPSLARADYAYLREIFNNARILIDVYYNMNQAAYAANLLKDNYDKVPDPKAFFESSMKALEDCAASKDVRWLTTQRNYVYGDVAGEMQKVISAYRQYAGEK